MPRRSAVVWHPNCIVCARPDVSLPVSSWPRPMLLEERTVSRTSRKSVTEKSVAQKRSATATKKPAGFGRQNRDDLETHDDDLGLEVEQPVDARELDTRELDEGGGTGRTRDEIGGRHRAHRRSGADLPDADGRDPAVESGRRDRRGPANRTIAPTVPPRHVADRLHASGGDGIARADWRREAPIGPHGRGLGHEHSAEAADPAALGTQPRDVAKPAGAQSGRISASPRARAAPGASDAPPGAGWSGAATRPLG